MTLDDKLNENLDFSDLFRKHAQFDDDYKFKCFVIWYQNGKPGSVALQKIIPIDPNTDKKVAIRNLEFWIKGDFIPKAFVIDQAVEEWQTRHMISREIDMLERQADYARQLQQFGIEYLQENGIKSERAAIQALIQGAKLEKESVIPGEKAKLAALSTQELVNFLIDSTPTIVDSPRFKELSEQIDTD